ncbi:MAG: hypothetical protein ACI8P3_002762 [Saprospiraceae bacterium]|jgi:hypothetical protein
MKKLKLEKLFSLKEFILSREEAKGVKGGENTFGTVAVKEETRN